MITIDGSLGEGGGQVLRTSLALSLVTGKPFGIRRIRAGRPKPGLMRQHLTAVLAAAEVGQAEVRGASLGSRELSFTPGAARRGDYSFDVGTAGSCTLVLQTVLPALMLADGPSQLCLRGGTHNIYAPPFDFLQKAFLPLLARMGPQVDATLDRPGFYPAGGGQMTVAIRPAQRQGGRQSSLTQLELLDRGPIVRRLARGVVSRLPRHIAQREIDTLRQRLDWPAECTAVEEVGSPGPGNVLIVELQSQHATEVFSGFGQRGCGLKPSPRALPGRWSNTSAPTCRSVRIWPTNSSSRWPWSAAGVSARSPPRTTREPTSTRCGSSSTCGSPPRISARVCGRSRATLFSPDYSRPNTSPTRKRGSSKELPSLARRASVAHAAPRISWAVNNPG